ncbi:hypothetical protein CW304_16780 [Bacillus sp. UFRGS-B20]|nr:hypothetical protein CW304_16780 [Bacillus sp. UFRGS-B20]
MWRYFPKRVETEQVALLHILKLPKVILLMHKLYLADLRRKIFGERFEGMVHAQSIQNLFQKYRTINGQNYAGRKF